MPITHPLASNHSPSSSTFIPSHTMFISVISQTASACQPLGNYIKAVGSFYSFVGGVYISITVYEGFSQEIGLHYICGELCFFANTQYVDVNMIT
jgi:hypothetical protein